MNLPVPRRDPVKLMQRIRQEGFTIWNTINSLQVYRHCLATLLVVENVLAIEGETPQRKSWRKRRRRVRISLLNHGSSFLSDFKSNGTPTGVPDFSYIPKGQKKKTIPPQIHTTGRGNQRQESGSDQKNVTLQRTPYNIITAR